MQIDRSKFLALTTVISTTVLAAMASATGCSSTATTTDGGPTADGSSPDTGGGIDGSSDSAVDSGPCLGDTDPTPTCTQEGVTVNPSCNGECSAAPTHLKKAVGTAYLACILALPTCEGADDAVASCASNAVARACADSTATAYCDGLVTTCHGDGGADAGDGGASLQQKCLAIAPALNAAGRTTFTTCITEGGCATPPDQCIAQVEGR